MAETTFAVTQTPGRSREISLNRELLAAGQVKIETNPRLARRCASSGLPIFGCKIRVVSEDGAELPPNLVGEIELQSASLFEGYRNDPAGTKSRIHDGWFCTGDYGFVHEGECYVVGRKKDLIVIAGKNLYPEDIEDAVGAVDGVIPGRVVAFGLEDVASGTEKVCVVAETPVEQEPQRAALKLRVIQAAMAVDVTISNIYFAPPRWLIKSSSGKLSRKANRERAIHELAFQE